MDDDRGTGTTREGPVAPTHRCGRCGAENDLDATFCAACDALLAAYDAPSGSHVSAADLPTEPLGTIQPAPADEPSVSWASQFGPSAQVEESDGPVPANGLPAPADSQPPEAPTAARNEPIEGPPGTTEDHAPSIPAFATAPVASASIDLPPEPADSPVDQPVAVPELATTEPHVAPVDEVEPTSGPAAIVPVVRSPDRSIVPVVQPGKPGRLARTSPATLLLFGAALSLGAIALIGLAAGTDGSGIVGGAGLALGAVALYVVAIGLIQAVLRRGRMLH